MSQCPDRQWLSVFFDGELPSPWKEKMEAHISGCPQCARRLEAYKNISLAFAGEEKPGMEPVRARVWQKLEQRAGGRQFRSGAVWRRRISVPLPAAAAVVLFLVLALLAALRITERADPSGITFASEAESDTPGIIPVSNMEDVLQYLGGRDNGDIIILRLPESRSFVNYGEPAMIKAADYSRNVSSRNMMRGRKP
ncbi:MAG: hypothetical protein LBG95_08795 [Treponema sp.]|jgi:hypothetical protein|nr:hypothetical protein [Treponema sp.]